jgi:hypothetical protein
LGESQTVTVRVVQVHLAVSPALIVGFQIEEDVVLRKLGVEGIDILYIESNHAPTTPSPENEDKFSMTPSRSTAK